MRQDAYQRERRHKVELFALEAQLQARLEVLTRANEALARDLERLNAVLGSRRALGPSLSEPLGKITPCHPYAITGKRFPRPLGDETRPPLFLRHQRSDPSSRRLAEFC